MQFFTWTRQEKETEKEFERYRDYLLRNRRDYDISAYELAAFPLHIEKTAIDNALINRVDWSLPDKLKLVLRAGNLITGYYNLTIKYQTPRLSRKDNSALSWVAKSTVSQFEHACSLYVFSLALIPGGYSQVFTFYSSTRFREPIQFEIQCAEIAWSSQSVRTRRLGPKQNRFPQALPSQEWVGLTPIKRDQ